MYREQMAHVLPLYLRTEFQSLVLHKCFLFVGVFEFPSIWSNVIATIDARLGRLVCPPFIYMER